MATNGQGVDCRHLQLKRLSGEHDDGGVRETLMQDAALQRCKPAPDELADGVRLLRCRA